MKNKLPWIYRHGKRIAKTHAIIDQLFRLINTLITSAGFRVFVTITIPFVLSIEVKCTQFDYSWNQWEFYTSIWYIILTAIIYGFLAFLIFSSDKYLKIIYKEFDYYKEAIAKQASVNSVIANLLYGLNNYITEKDDAIPTDEGIKNCYNYQKAAQLVCQEIYDIIKNVTDEDSHQVNLFKRFKRDDGSEFIQMIAFANKESVHPASWGSTYELNTNSKKKYYHQKIFDDNISMLYKLKNNAEIINAFKLNKKREEREWNLQQYIGIPIFCNEQRVVSLLQIDTDVPNLFGETYDDITKFCRMFLPFIHLLLVNYYNERLIHSFWGKIKYKYKRDMEKQKRSTTNKAIKKGSG